MAINKSLINKKGKGNWVSFAEREYQTKCSVCRNDLIRTSTNRTSAKVCLPCKKVRQKANYLMNKIGLPIIISEKSKKKPKISFTNKTIPRDCSKCGEKTMKNERTAIVVCFDCKKARQAMYYKKWKKEKLQDRIKVVK